MLTHEEIINNFNEERERYGVGELVFTAPVFTNVPEKDNYFSGGKVYGYTLLVEALPPAELEVISPEGATITPEGRFEYVIPDPEPDFFDVEILAVNEAGEATAVWTVVQEVIEVGDIEVAGDLLVSLDAADPTAGEEFWENQGTLDKYIGDAIVAFFGAPMPVKDHEYWACKTAIIMQAQLKILRQRWESEGDRWPERVHAMQNRIGIHTGPMVTGNMGSTQRMNYTMMGDTVNLAARLESSAKQYGVYIQISENTYNAAKDRLTVRELDTVIVVGKTEPVKTYELIAEKDQESAPVSYTHLTLPTNREV